MPPLTVEEEEELIVTLSGIVGMVEVLKGAASPAALGSPMATLAEDGTRVNIGDIIKTGKGSYATISFLPWIIIEVSENSEIRIVRHELGSLNTRVDVLTGNISKAIIQNLPPNSLFQIILLDYLALEAEPFPEEGGPIGTTVNPFSEPGSDF